MKFHLQQGQVVSELQRELCLQGVHLQQIVAELSSLQMKLLQRLQPSNGVWEGVVERLAPLPYSNHLIQLPHPLAVQAALGFLSCSKLLLKNSQPS